MTGDADSGSGRARCPVRGRVVATLAAWLLLASAGSVPAQESGATRAPDAAWWGVNVGLATTSALLHALQRRAPVSRVLLAGVVGGTVIYGGQRVVGTGETGWYPLGMGIVAVGASLPRNVGREDGLLGEVVVPFYPAYVQLQPHRQPHIRLRVSAAAVVGGVLLGVRYGTTPRLTPSLLSGAIVYAVPGEFLECRQFDFFGCRIAAAGAHTFGSYAYADDEQSREERTLTRVHERSHLTQDSRDALLFAVSASDLVLSDSMAITRWIKRFVVLDFLQVSRFADRGLRSGDLVGCGRHSFRECEVEALLSRRMRGRAP